MSCSLSVRLCNREFRYVKEYSDLLHNLLIEDSQSVKRVTLFALQNIKNLTSLLSQQANAAIKPRAETACRLCRGGAVKGRQRRANGYTKCNDVTL